jgi:uncharacterized protein (DUF433 family)
MSATDDDALIQKYVEDNPNRPGPVKARLRESGTEVWAIIEYLQKAVGGDHEQTAHDYHLSPEEMRAAYAYYLRHKDVIDARIIVNAA